MKRGRRTDKKPRTNQDTSKKDVKEKKKDTKTRNQRRQLAHEQLHRQRNSQQYTNKISSPPKLNHLATYKINQKYTLLPMQKKEKTKTYITLNTKEYNLI